MTSPPIPVIFEPIFKPKPWGGRKLAEVLSKSLPPDEPIGESWELVSLPENESRVRTGPLAGTPIGVLVETWGTDLYGGASLADGRFPLLIKFLDARENLSVQVHPKPAKDVGGGWRPGIKHEAWYIIAAEPGAELFIGLKPGVTHADVVKAADTPAMADLLRRWPATVGRCYYLPSGTMHALGAGILVAEVQTPSDITYRIYDWDRVGADGRPRELHIEQALENTDYDVRNDQILQPRRHVAGVFSTATHETVCEKFIIEKLRISEGITDPITYGEMAIWIVLKGRGVVKAGTLECPFSAGDTLLLPAAARDMTVQTLADCEWLDVKIPIVSDLAGLPHPSREQPRPADGGVPLTISGKPPQEPDNH